MIDMHCHLLPGVDDGAKDLDQTLTLIDQGLEQGVDEYVLTPHVIDDFSDEIDALHTRAYEKLLETVSKRSLPVRFSLASEIMFQFDIARVKSKPSSTFANNGVYFLMEFPMASFPAQAEDVLFNFQMAGMKPIIAHPERNGGLANDLPNLYRMASRGILMQVNARSLLGMGGPQAQKVAETLVLSGVANFVASDAHRPGPRGQSLAEAYARICEFADEETAKLLTLENPRRAVAGEKIATVQLEYKSKLNFLKNLLNRFNKFTKR